LLQAQEQSPYDIADKIAVTTDRDSNEEIYLMNADGSNLINLTNNPADDEIWGIA
jgi:Tol biopolymer transport system component